LNDRAGWVLTGGQSRRMGQDKALIEIKGRPLVLLIADRLRTVCRTVALVGDPARYGSLGLPVVADRFPGFGPLAGIEAALAATTETWNLVVACDMPALDSAVLEQLFGPAADISVPRYESGFVEPLCAVYHRRCHAAILSALEAGTRKITEALEQLAAAGFTLRYIPVTDPGPFANLNTPEDLRRYKHG
jgi:molybdopterin-guanine dinucleotide biosynthesis protein A